MSLCRSRTASAPWIALCVFVCTSAALMGPVCADDILRLDSALTPIPTMAPAETGRLILPVGGTDESDLRQFLRVDVAQPGNSGRDEQARAVQRIPTSKLTPAQVQKINSIVRAPSLYRRLPTVTLRTDPRVYSYFVENPDVAVSIWRVMGISDMQLRQVSDNEYEADMKDGNIGVLTVLHRSEHSQLVLCEGDFKSPLLAKPIKSTGLMCLQSRQWQGQDGTNYVTHVGDVFVVFQSDAVEAIAKLISPMSFKLADKNFEEVSIFIRMMDEAMAHEPGWIERTASHLDGVIPGRDKELLEVAAKVYVDARRRELQRAGGPVSLEAIRPPVQTASGM